MVAILAFLVVLGVLIFVHELGHFLAAKWAGMYVHRFSIGMGPTIPWFTRRIGETEYALSWLPLGGYVRVATAEGEAGSEALEGGSPDDAEVPPERMYERKPVWKRIIFVLGGVVFNLVFAWIVYAGLALKNGRPVDPVTTVGGVDVAALPKGAEALGQLATGDRITAVGGTAVETWDAVQERLVNAGGDAVSVTLADGRTLSVDVHQDALGDRLAAAQAVRPLRTAVVGQLVPSRPAERAGFAVGDSITAIDGIAVRQWSDVVTILEASAGRPLTVTVVRGARMLDLAVTPDAEELKGADGTVRTVGRIGLGVRTAFRMEPYTAGQAVVAGGQAVLDGIVQIWRTIKGMLTARIARSELGGPILIGQLAGQSARLGPDALLGLMALLSVNLAVFNLLPIPVLDGGQLLFLLAEGVLRRPVSLRVREWFARLGLVAILALMLLAFSNDIRRLLGL